MVSKAWKELSDDEREVWEEIARKDKARYEMEKAVYKGPWKVPTKAKFPRDQEEAPKRPMSAYMGFSNSKRAEVKSRYPSADSTEISRILAQMWREASEDERKIYVDKEQEQRQQYKNTMSQWDGQRKDTDFQPERKDVSSRSMRLSMGGNYFGGHSSNYDYSGQGSSTGSTQHVRNLELQGHSAQQGYHGTYYGTTPPSYHYGTGYYQSYPYYTHPSFSNQDDQGTMHQGDRGVPYADHQSSFSAASAANLAGMQSIDPYPNPDPYDHSNYYSSQHQAMQRDGFNFNQYSGRSNYDYSQHPSQDTSYAPLPSQTSSSSLMRATATNDYHETPMGRDGDQRGHLAMEDVEPSPLSASRDIFSSAFDIHPVDESPQRKDDQKNK